MFNRAGSKGAFRLPGATWDHFLCTVEPSSGQIRCRHLVVGLDGRNRAIVIAESLAGLIAAIRIAGVRGRSYLLGNEIWQIGF